jgi:hypothetical protein
MEGALRVACRACGGTAAIVLTGGRRGGFGGRDGFGVFGVSCEADDLSSTALGVRELFIG